MTIQLRRGTAAEWTAAKPVLKAGEVGIELGSGRFKIGNGTAPWTSLPYTDTSAASGASVRSGTHLWVLDTNEEAAYSFNDPADRATYNLAATGPNPSAVITMPSLSDPDRPPQPFTFVSMNTSGRVQFLSHPDDPVTEMGPPVFVFPDQGKADPLDPTQSFVFAGSIDFFPASMIYGGTETQPLHGDFWFGYATPFSRGNGPGAPVFIANPKSDVFRPLEADVPMPATPFISPRGRWQNAEVRVYYRIWTDQPTTGRLLFPMVLLNMNNGTHMSVGAGMAYDPSTYDVPWNANDRLGFLDTTMENPEGFGSSSDVVLRVGVDSSELVSDTEDELGSVWVEVIGVRFIDKSN